MVYHEAKGPKALDMPDGGARKKVPTKVQNLVKG